MALNPSAKAGGFLFLGGPTLAAMLPVLPADQMLLAEQYAIEREPISSIDLMERAATACFGWLVRHERQIIRVATAPRYVVFCGRGNNGGDGLAIARLLHGSGRAAAVYLVGGGAGSINFQVNLARIPSGLPVVIVDGTYDVEDLLAIHEPRILIDALFGIGLNKPLQGQVKEVVMRMNNSGSPIISVDLPSGLPADGVMDDVSGIVRATHTLTFQCPKPALVYGECSDHIGEPTVLPIGMDADFLFGLDSMMHLVEHADVQALVPSRHRFDHKGRHGHALIIGGNQGMMGAAVLSVKAASRSGTGLVTAYVPGCGTPIIQVSAPEAMCLTDENDASISSLPDLSVYSGIGVGPGLGLKSDGMLKRLIQDARTPLVIDADALNTLAENRTWLAFLKEGTVLTPHPKEFDRLFGQHKTSRERIARAGEEASRLGLVIVLKGAYTAICTPGGKVYFNPTGDPGMAKGGCGDVLTGLLTGLLARGIPPVSAALLGTFIHGRAGELAAERIGREGMTAMDIVHLLPDAWREITD